MQAIVTEKNVFDSTYVVEGEQPQSPIDPDVGNNGEWVFVTNFIRSWNLETWVRRVAHASGQRVDWTYGGPRAFVIALDDIRKVRLAIAGLLHEHDAMWRVMRDPKNHEADLGAHPSREWALVRDILRPGSIEDARIVYGLSPDEAFTAEELLAHHAARVAIVGPHRFHPHEATYQAFATSHVRLLDDAKDILMCATRMRGNR